MLLPKGGETFGQSFSVLVLRVLLQSENMDRKCSSSAFYKPKDTHCGARVVSIY